MTTEHRKAAPDGTCEQVCFSKLQRSDRTWKCTCVCRLKHEALTSDKLSILTIGTAYVLAHPEREKGYTNLLGMDPQGHNPLPAASPSGKGSDK